jgi:sulfide dehydrogenase [flavocytochrome c] flavoprotein subunit
MAPGIRFLWDKPEGYTEAVAERMPHAWEAGEQTALLGAQLAAMREGGVVAISVPAGPMRCPPGPFERASLMAYYFKRRNPRAKILIFDANNRFPRQDDFTDAWRSHYPGMIEWIPVVEGGAVLRVDPAQKTLYTSKGVQHADVVNIIPPQAPAALAVQAGLAQGHGWCPIESDTFASTVVSDVHVIGDACIADPMPKSGSAANAQGRRCAHAIAAALTGAGTAEATMQSVCYSLLGADLALSIHARFEVDDGAIKQLPAAEETLSPESEAVRASQWYSAIVADAFGAPARALD